jgi:[ribosomal protein S5]-alanine N-acetyltransferase
MRLDCSSICVVRSWRRSDKFSLVRFGNNRKIWRNLTDSCPSPYRPSDADDWLDCMAQLDPCTHYAIDIKGRAVGGIGVMPLKGIYSKTGEFGYWLGEPYWGQGIATAAAKAVAAYAFESLDLERLEAGVFMWNPASMRVLEKVGFVREGISKRSVFKDGQLVDRAMYALLRNP